MLTLICFLTALLTGALIAANGFAIAPPLLLSLTALLILRLVLKNPFYRALSFYISVAAFNYYYFYCSRFTGRNPTDVGDWGIPATPLEKAQKDILFFVLLGLALIQLFRYRMAGQPLWFKRLEHPIYKWLGAFMAFVLIRGIFWIWQGDTTFDLLFYWRTHLEWALLPFLIATVLLKKEAQLEGVLKTIVYALPVVACLGIVEFFLNGSPYQRSFYGGHIFSRAVATLQNPNNLGGYLATAMGLFILLFSAQRLNRWERWLFWPSIPLGLTCLFMTLSRSSLLFFFLAITLNLALLFRQTLFSASGNKTAQRIALWAYGGVGLISIGVLYQFFDLQHAFQDAVELYVQSSVVSNARFYAPAVTLGMLLEHPLAALFGYSKSVVWAGADNAFANVLLRNGLIGFSLYMGVWLSALWSSFRQAYRAIDSAPGILSLLCFYILSFQFLYAFTAPVHENFPHNLYFWFTVGTIAWINSRPIIASHENPIPLTESIPNTTRRRQPLRNHPSPSTHSNTPPR